MTAFAIAAALCAVAALLFIALPWVRAAQATSLRARALPLLVALVAVGSTLALYAHLSSWPWKSGNVDAGTPAELVNLKRATDERPNDLQGWLRLGQAYLEVEQFPLARTVFERANRLAGGGSAEALSGLAEAMALGGDANTGRVRELFERALQLDPRSAKALFYTAIIALRSNELPVARQRFATMLTLDLPPDVRSTLQKQIETIDAQLAPAAIDARTVVRVNVSVGPALRARFEASAANGATLFVFVRGPEGGAPLAAKRLASQLPQAVVLSSADAMMPSHAIQPGQAVKVAARLSAGGSPLPQSGDLSGEIAYTAGKDGPRELVISQVIP